ncbi:MAG: hypothetical protein Q8M40_14255 [Legionella sp.]|nr:hypothetical protein [Legionella sp.]
MTSFLSSELIIKPNRSSIYLRFIALLYFLSFALIGYAQLNAGLKIIFIVLLLLPLKSSLREQSACPSVDQIQYRNDLWYLWMKMGSNVSYENATILIHNDFFQLICFSNENQKKVIVLFNDQLSTQQLRLLHIKTQ